MRRLATESPEARAAALREAARVLQGGGLVAFPTETVYGIAIDAGSAAAVKRLYAVKGRAAARACAFLVPDRARAEKFCGGLPPIAARIADRLWPGPVTLVVPGRRGRTIGLRLPAAPLARDLAAAAGRPLLQTSANRTGKPAALNAAGVAAALGDDLDLLLDGGRVPGGRSSTVVACDARRYRILREGAVDARTIEDAATRLVLVACTGNLCRSPVAEAMLRHALADALGCAPDELAAHGFRIGSFGTMAMEGRPATDHSVTVAAEHDLDISGHRSRPFSLRGLAEADTVYCLARNHYDFLRPYFEARPEALQLLDPDDREIHDPYGRSLKTYRKTGEQIARAVEDRARELAGREEEPTD
jgi:tRNA threonylcarbamoyl adenosine modification protein (Sua5/YciO/YrdC/YwlC family)